MQKNGIKAFAVCTTFETLGDFNAIQNENYGPCAKKKQVRLFGGRSATTLEFPFVGRIFDATKNWRRPKHTVGTVNLISSCWALTG